MSRWYGLKWKRKKHKHKPAYYYRSAGHSIVASWLLESLKVADDCYSRKPVPVQVVASVLFKYTPVSCLVETLYLSQ